MGMDQRRVARAGETEDPRGNPPTSDIVRHDPHGRVVRTVYAPYYEELKRSSPLKSDTRRTSLIFTVGHSHSSSGVERLKPGDIKFIVRTDAMRYELWKGSEEGFPTAANHEMQFHVVTPWAAVAERLACSPSPRRTGLSLAGSRRTSACGNRAGRCRWPAGFLGDLPFPPLFHSGVAPYTPHFTLDGSQDLDVKSFPNIFTHMEEGGGPPPSASVLACPNKTVLQDQRKKVQKFSRMQIRKIKRAAYGVNHVTAPRGYLPVQPDRGLVHYRTTKSRDRCRTTIAYLHLRQNIHPKILHDISTAPATPTKQLSPSHTERFSLRFRQRGVLLAAGRARPLEISTPTRNFAAG
ncbi:hypothetical protein PR048_006433 [Dryococelus australis]|uniref:Uncharacterized protein n=1 Tax=Dryococelus australis TaxID=614101 RepID=A0ABQ9IAZ9_9NEOP|nr:hypothetical protein PR048_006433 [Dryococelus australis]